MKNRKKKRTKDATVRNTDRYRRKVRKRTLKVSTLKMVRETRSKPLQSGR